MFYLFLFASLWVGSVVASYFNVLVDRGFVESLWGRSHCDHCGKQIAEKFLLPIVSTAYLLLVKRKTACCGKPLSPQYLLAEILGALTFGLAFYHLAWIYWEYGVHMQILPIVAFAITTMLFLFLAVHDIWKFEIDLYPLAAMAVLFVASSLLYPQFSSFLWGHDVLSQESLFAALGFGAVVVLLIVLSRGRGLGAGDVFVVAFIGLSLGLQQAAVSLQLTIYLATAVGLVYAAIKKQFKGLIVPLVPFLLLGWQLALLFTDQLLSLLNKLSYI